jgi:hypothetical protein
LRGIYDIIGKQNQPLYVTKQHSWTEFYTNEQNNLGGNNIMDTLFGNVNESVKLVERKQLDVGRIQTVFKYGNLTVSGISNIPSESALERSASILNEIADKHVRNSGGGRIVA